MDMTQFISKLLPEFNSSSFKLPVVSGYILIALISGVLLTESIIIVVAINNRLESSISVLNSLLASK